MPTTSTPWTDTGTGPTADGVRSGHDTAVSGGHGHAAGGGLPPTARQDPHRPGWRGVVAVAAGAAVLASLATAGTLNAFGSPATASTSTTSQQSAPLVTGGGKAPNWVATAAAVKPSVVSVRVQASDGSGGQGSGVILDTTGRVLTNNHVVADAGAGATISVELSDGRTYDATVVGTDPATDLAVLAMKKAPSGLGPPPSPTPPWSRSVTPSWRSGTRWACRHRHHRRRQRAEPPSHHGARTPQPQGPSGSHSRRVSRSSPTPSRPTLLVNPGNSGGALVDSGGRVIGITSSIASLGAAQGSQAGSIGLGFAIPANEAKDVAHQLVTTGTVQHAYLGVTLADGMVTVAAPNVRPPSSAR